PEGAPVLAIFARSSCATARRRILHLPSKWISLQSSDRLCQRLIPQGGSCPMSFGKNSWRLVLALAIATTSFALPRQAEQSAKQDTKTAAQETKDAAKHTGRAVKTTTKKTGHRVKKTTQSAGHQVKKTTKRATHKVASKTRQGAQKVEGKTQTNQ